jgi:dipeptidyl aminopeptidase/acylaminoacyl peptidase
MTADQRFERHLPSILEDLYLGPTPTYRDEVMTTVMRTRQRPSWTFPGRWLPMADIASRPAFAPRVPWRTVGVALLIVALLIATMAIYFGTRPTRLPAPFGVARNGLIAYTVQGDIYVANVDSGRITRVTNTPELDAEPVFAPNGTHIAYRRQVAGDQSLPPAEDIVVIKPDGSDPVVVTASPIPGGPKRLEWSPDSNSILATEQNDTAVWLFDASGRTPMRTILTGSFAYVRPFRPPDGAELLIGRASDGKHSIISYDLATGHETILAADLPGDDSAARWSPDGSRVVYNAAPADEPDLSRLFVVGADGSETQRLSTEAGISVDVDPAWSPDGTRIAFTHWQRQETGDWDVLPMGIYSMADGTVRSVGPLPREVRARYPEANDVVATRGEGFFFDWSPDGRSLLAYPSEAKGHAILIDTVDGTWRALDPVIDTVGWPQSQGWQRMALEP